MVEFLIENSNIAELTIHNLLSLSITMPLIYIFFRSDKATQISAWLILWVLFARSEPGTLADITGFALGFAVLHYTYNRVKRVI